MTRDALLQVLREIVARDSGDIEVDHAEADKALLEFINDDEIAAAYAAIDKWYA